MSDIKKGTHGVLTNSNSGVTIPATYYNQGGIYFNVIIDGMSLDSPHTNSFYPSEGWTFEPDKVLPTEIGSVIQITKWHDDASGPEWRALLTRGGWRVAIDHEAMYSASNLEERRANGKFDFEVVL